MPLPGFQNVLYKVISIRDRSLPNTHELLIGDTEVLADAAGPVVQADGTNPRFIKTDRQIVAFLVGEGAPGEALSVDAEFWEVRYSLDGLSEVGFTKNLTYWLRFDGATRLTRAFQVFRERVGDTKIRMFFEIAERL